jgi:transposase InsO family protein
MRQYEKTQRSRRVELRQGWRRRLELGVRVDVVAFARWCGAHGLSRTDAAAKLGLAAGTLHSWNQSWRACRLQPRARGRRVARPPARERNMIIAMFALLGPGVGATTLRAYFPWVARRELEDLARRYRRVYRWRRRRVLHALSWCLPGTVWAMDFAEAPIAIDQAYPLILLVRDLASGRQLLALPVSAATAEVTCAALIGLFMRHGAPLILKSDNGSAFIAAELRCLLERWGVEQLLSPPATPEYNGACEAGVGSLKTRAHHEAARHGRPGEWTCDDVEAACAMANETARPWGATAPTPNQAWRARYAISQHQRMELRATIQRCREEEKKRLMSKSVELTASNAASIDRIAIGRALVEHGYLQLRRGWVSPQVFRRRAAEIT